MKRILVISSIFISALFIISCSHFAYMDALLKIDKGMSIDDVSEILGNSDYFYSFVGNDEDVFTLDDVTLEEYGDIQVILKQKFTPSKKIYYVFAFQNDKLIYWGHPLEFTRSNDQMLSDIGVVVSRMLIESEPE